MRHQIGAAHGRAQYTTATGRRGSAGGRAILLGVVALILALTLAVGVVGGFYTSNPAQKLPRRQRHAVLGAGQLQRGASRRKSRSSIRRTSAASWFGAKTSAASFKSTRPPSRRRRDGRT